MALLQVHDVVRRADAPLLVARCVQGIVRVGDALVAVERADGAAVPLDLVVEGITTVRGPVDTMRSGEAGQVQVSAGSSVDGLRDGTVRTADARRAQSPAARSFAETRVAPAPSILPAGSGGEPAPPAVDVGPALPMNRWTVAFRWLLALPVMVVVDLLGLAAWVVAFLGWFAALFTGALPASFGNFLVGYLTVTARVTAYAWLLTDRFPPVSFQAPDYPVQVSVEPTRLNRLAVLFRVVLALPAALVVTVASFGWVLVSVVLWVVALVTGRLPQPAQQVGAAVLRYAIRYNAYYLMTTSAYPTGLFGDTAGTQSAAESGRPGVQVSAETGEEPFRPPAYATAAPFAAAPRAALALSRGARQLLAGTLVVGVVAFVGVGALDAVRVHRLLAGTPLTNVEQAHATLAGNIQDYQREATGCAQATDRLACMEAADVRLADRLDEFTDQVKKVHFPAAATASVQSMQADAERMSSGLRAAAGAQTITDYQAAIQQSGLAQVGQAFDGDYATVVATLRASAGRVGSD